jgi:hypothetical protein
MINKQIPISDILRHLHNRLHDDATIVKDVWLQKSLSDDIFLASAVIKDYLTMCERDLNQLIAIASLEYGFRFDKSVQKRLEKDFWEAKAKTLGIKNEQ